MSIIDKVAELEGLARSMVSHNFVTLTCWRDGWQANLRGSGPFESERYDNPFAALDELTVELLRRKRHDDNLAKTLGATVAA